MKHAARRYALFRLISIWLALVVCVGGVSPNAHSADVKPAAHTGTLQGALYRIDIPAKWNGDLVMIMHGYQPAGIPIKSPMTPADVTPVFLKQGYAVAQSQYTSQGWAVGEAIVDNERLRRYFIRTFAHPAHTYVYGFSLGGLETAASIERYPHAYTGALIVCGATLPTPETVARVLLTPLVAFDALIPGVLPDLAAPDSPAFIPPDVFIKALQAHPKEAALLEKRLQETPETLSTLSLYYMALRELERRADGMPMDNTKTVYHGFGDDAEFNRRVHRYAGSPAAMAYAARNVTLTGRIDTSVVMQWNAFDPTIPSRFHSLYPDLVRAAGNEKWMTVLPPAGQGHCNFTDAQISTAFHTLVHKAGAEEH